MIACNLITQTIAELKIAFSKCMKIKNSDLSKLVDLSVALATCRTYPYKVYVATVNKSTNFDKSEFLIFMHFENAIFNSAIVCVIKLQAIIYYYLKFHYS